MNSVESWLAYLEALHPVEIDLGLQRVGEVLDRLQLPRQWPMPVVMLAGTNGKGTTGAALVAMAKACGYRVGWYSSPHLLRYNERICDQQGPIADADLCRAFAAVEAARADISLSYFEFGTLAALWHFWQQQPDLLVLEVGLGGRLDAVNLIDAEISVITNVDFDHQQFLGNSLEAIGREKAGILRAGRLALVGMAEPPQSVLAQAESLGCPLKLWQRDFDLSTAGQFESDAGSIADVSAPNLPRVNLALALRVMQALTPKLVFRLDLVRQALRQVRLLGRMTLIPDGEANWLLDVAHNPQSVAYLAEQLRRFPARRKIAVCSMLADKDIAASLQPIAEEFDQWWLVGLDVPRGLSAEALQQRVPEIDAKLAVDVAQACQQLQAQAQPGDLWVVFGSFYTLAAALNAEPLATLAADIARG